MPKPTFRDRFYTPPVARALYSPLGILLGGAGVAAGLVVGLPVAAAVAVGAVAYGARVAAAIPKGPVVEKMNPFELDEPWRTFAWQARKSQRQFAESVHITRDGPLKDRLREIADRIDTGVMECWQVAQSGQQLTQARARVDVASITRDLEQLPSGEQRRSNPALVATAQALQAQLDTAARMDGVIVTARDRLRLLDARLGELVTRVIELSVRPRGLDELAAVGADVDNVVGEMEALRQALDETDNAGSAGSGSGRAIGSGPTIGTGAADLPALEPPSDPPPPPGRS
jgi:hypothetical protein